MGELVSQCVGWLVSRLLNWLVGGLDGGLVSRSVGRLVGHVLLSCILVCILIICGCLKIIALQGLPRERRGKVVQAKLTGPFKGPLYIYIYIHIVYGMDHTYVSILYIYTCIRIHVGRANGPMAC